MRVTHLSSRTLRETLWPLLDDDIQACRDFPNADEIEFFHVRTPNPSGPQPTSWLLMSDEERAEIRPQHRLRLLPGGAARFTRHESEEAA
ncbi:hypothetical protein FKR81_12685 [Lentzea tibetensis]|uniref:Uncharacterized protein n=1 Tax=Lentzea tibetensis TaxID=2591470 RepID=A0A563EW14_9PSEU|nr:hypothetical protein [Lentzea tibetensis]TWP51718.1 hypothetical protein FKR81_12685 [Lentzea tibetensis]